MCCSYICKAWKFLYENYNHKAMKATGKKMKRIAEVQTRNVETKEKTGKSWLLVLDD